MSHWNYNTLINRTCPLRTIVAVGEPRPSPAPGSVHCDWVDETLDCGHIHTTYAVRAATVGRRRRCMECGRVGHPA